MKYTIYLYNWTTTQAGTQCPDALESSELFCGHSQACKSWLHLPSTLLSNLAHCAVLTCSSFSGRPSSWGVVHGPQMSEFRCRWWTQGVTVNFMCQPEWAEVRDAQRAGKTIFLVVSVRVSPEEISIWIGRLRKEDHPHHCKWTSPNCWAPQQNKKAGSPIFSCPRIRCSCFPGLWTKTGTSTIRLAGSTACRQQIIGPLGLHTHMSQLP